MAATRRTRTRSRQPMIDLTREELIQKWYDFREKYNKEALKSKTGKLPACIMCKELYGRRLRDRGRGSTFYRGDDGAYIGKCGGNTKVGPCDGMNIVPVDYVDSATLHTELRSAKDEIMRELKHVRDRVFGTENLTKEDDAEFRALTREYTGIRKMEEQYKANVSSNRFTGASYTVEETSPETKGGANRESMRFHSNKILDMMDTRKEFDMGDMVLGVVCKEDLPVRV